MRVPLLSHGEERRLLIGRNAHEGGKGAKMFAMAQRHVLREIVKVDGGKDVRFL